MLDAESDRTEKSPHLKRRIEKLLLVREASAAVASELDAAYSLRLVMDNATRLLDADRSTLFLLDQERQELWSFVAHGLGTTEIRLPIGTGIAGQVAMTGETLNIADAYADPRFHGAVDESTGYRTRSLLCIPLQDRRGRIIGVIEVMNKRRGEFTRKDEESLQQLCSQAVLLLGAQMVQAPRR